MDHLAKIRWAQTQIKLCHPERNPSPPWRTRTKSKDPDNFSFTMQLQGVLPRFAQNLKKGPVLIS